MAWISLVYRNIPAFLLPLQPAILKRKVPELPEVETIVRSLRSRLVNRQIRHVEIRSALITRLTPRRTAAKLKGSVVKGVERRGKHILLALDKGLLHIHLGMTGKLLWNTEPTKFARAIAELDQGRLIFDDIRQFGHFDFYDNVPAVLTKVGPDPLLLTADGFIDRVRRHRGAIKPLLLNQSFVSGLGNIYVDEVLFAANIHPLSLAHELSLAGLIALHRELQRILLAAIECRGSSISDYVDGDGQAGSFQLHHQAYGKKGSPCPKCETPIERLVIAQRGTHVCPSCQRFA